VTADGIAGRGGIAEIQATTAAVSSRWGRCRRRATVLGDEANTSDKLYTSVISAPRSIQRCAQVAEATRSVTGVQVGVLVKSLSLLWTQSSESSTHLSTKIGVSLHSPKW